MQILTIHINTPTYEIPYFVGSDLWGTLTGFLKEHHPAHRIFLISDDHVADLHGQTARHHLQAHPGFQDVLTFPAGEASKSRQQKDRLEDRLLAARAGRDSLLIAMGGGVTGDLVGYVAATLHRGIPLVHLPTSLLAQVDSSIGGKVGINHAAGKNLIGAFYQPRAIFCEVNFLRTLPAEEFLNGMAEVIKYAAILDDELWDWLDQHTEALLNRDTALVQKVIARCAALKIAVVEADEKENGYRSILNFGHTVGHAIEQLSGYRIKHGFAIAAGMRVAARLSHRRLGYPTERLKRLEDTLASYHLNRVNPLDFPLDDIWNCILTDKKARDQKPRFSLINGANKPELFYPIQKQELENVLGVF